MSVRSTTDGRDSSRSMSYDQAVSGQWQTYHSRKAKKSQKKPYVVCKDCKQWAYTNKLHFTCGCNKSFLDIATGSKVGAVVVKDASGKDAPAAGGATLGPKQDPADVFALLATVLASVKGCSLPPGAEQTIMAFEEFAKIVAVKKQDIPKSKGALATAVQKAGGAMRKADEKRKALVVKVAKLERSLEEAKKEQTEVDKQYIDAQQEQAQAIKELVDVKEPDPPSATVAMETEPSTAQGSSASVAAAPVDAPVDAPEKLEHERKRRKIDATKVVSEQLDAIKKKLKERFNKKRKSEAEGDEEAADDDDAHFDIDVEFDNIAEAAATALTSAGIKSV